MEYTDKQTSKPRGHFDATEDNNIVVEEAVSKFTWELSRKDEVQQFNGAVLAVLVSVALQSSWKFPTGVQPSGNLIDQLLLDQLPKHFDEQQAKKFSREALRALGKSRAATDGAEGEALSELIDFIYRGAFDLRRLELPADTEPRRPMCRIMNIPDEIPTPAAKMKVISLDGEGVITVNVPDTILDHWANFETGDPDLHLHAIIPDETKHREVVLINKTSWDKASQVLRLFAESSDEVYADQFQKVLNQILSAEEFKKLSLDD